MFDGIELLPYKHPDGVEKICFFPFNFESLYRISFEMIEEAYI